MSRVLIVEDSASQAMLLKLTLQQAGFEVEVASDGAQALTAIAVCSPDVVLTDLMMPNMNGLELVEKIRLHHPLIPTILMTSHGSEEIAAEALQKGAISYIPKRRLDNDLLRTLGGVLSVTRSNRADPRLLNCWMTNDSTFELENSPSLVQPLVTLLQDDLSTMGLCDETSLLRIGMALTESLDNAIFHGNLQLDSQLREGDGRAWSQLAKERSTQLPYCDRRVHLTTCLSRNKAVFTIRDEGPGFNTSQLPDPTDPAQMENISGRGIFLMRTFMDEVTFNESGNEIRLVKLRER